MRESQIQTSIKTKLEKSGWFVTKLIQCSTNGIPDLMALKSGRAVFVECKVPGKKPTDLQYYVHDKLRRQGFEVITATTTTDINHLIENK